MYIVPKFCRSLNFYTCQRSETLLYLDKGSKFCFKSRSLSQGACSVQEYRLHKLVDLSSNLPLASAHACAL